MPGGSPVSLNAVTGAAVLLSHVRQERERETVACHLWGPACLTYTLFCSATSSPATKRQALREPQNNNKITNKKRHFNSINQTFFASLFTIIVHSHLQSQPTPTNTPPLINKKKSKCSLLNKSTTIPKPNHTLFCEKWKLRRRFVPHCLRFDPSPLFQLFYLFIYFWVYKKKRVIRIVHLCSLFKIVNYFGLLEWGLCVLLLQLGGSTKYLYFSSAY
jgi:hypothetical protein